MPAAPTWLPRLAEIRAALEQLDVPVLGRAEIERLFGLRRRQALRLLSPLATLEAGRTGLVERQALLAWLDSLAAKKSVALEIGRRQKLDRSLKLHLQTLARQAEARRRAVELPEPVDEENWPAGVTLASLSEDGGELRIRYRRAEDLLGRVLALTELAAQDPGRFAARVEKHGGGQESGPETAALQQEAEAEF